MGHIYQGISWNRQKRVYDRIMLACMGLYLLVFTAMQLVFYPPITPETLMIRATGSLALIMLHVILLIGPLARIDRRFLPLLYNRRHLGVSMFLMAAVHGLFSIIQFHALGNMNPFASVFLSNLHYTSISRFPFQSLGFFALLLLFLMAATSHDFWLRQLGPRFWKSLHLMVYLAYGLIVMHVMLGVVQLETSPVYVSLMGLGLAVVTTAHLYVGLKQWRLDKSPQTDENQGFYEVCSVNDIPDRRAKVLLLKGENIAIFRYNNRLSAVNNVCKHQNGPLGEGKIVDNCIVCPWHGYEYRPEDGCAPPPFTEKVTTYELRLQDGRVWVNPHPHPEGTRIEPVRIKDGAS